jgi:hypothetical protein
VWVEEPIMLVIGTMIANNALEIGSMMVHVVFVCSVLHNNVREEIEECRYQRRYNISNTVPMSEAFATPTRDHSVGAPLAKCQPPLALGSQQCHWG